MLYMVLNLLLDLLPVILILLPVILILRWIVWRQRLRNIRDEFDAIRAQMARLRDELESLRVPPSATKVSATEPQAAPGQVGAAGEAATQPAEVLSGGIARQPTEPAQRRSRTPAVPSTVFEPPSERQPPDRRLLLHPSPLASIWRWLAATFPPKQSEDEWEARLGGRWLNKIGIVVLVIGVALLLNFSFANLDPPGKIALGLLLGIALTVSGVRAERRPRYAIIGHSLVGGGWALLYFTAYAAYNIKAAQIISNPAIALGALFAVAAPMILHSLRYRSEVATTLAYVLGFLAIDISPLSLYSLLAVAILAASLVTILYRTRWLVLGLFGVVATYLTHFVWSVSAAAPPGSDVTQAFWISESMLVLYWLLFASFDILRAVPAPESSTVPVLTNLLNALGFILLSAIQTGRVYPERVYLLGIAVAIAYAVKSGWLRRIGWSLLHRIDGIIAIGAVAVAWILMFEPLGIPDEWVPVGLAAEAGLVLTIGFRLREYPFRAAGHVLLAASLVDALAVTVLGASSLAVIAESHHEWLPNNPLQRWITIPLLIAGLFSLESLQRHISVEPVQARDRSAGIAASYAAALLLAALLWREVAGSYLGLAWTAAGMVLFELGVLQGHRPRRIEAYAFCIMAIGVLLWVNLYGVVPVAGPVPKPWWITMPIAASGYAMYLQLRRAARMGRIGGIEAELTDWPAHGATAVIAILLWKELDPPGVALAWGALALIAYETGRALKLNPITLHGHVLAMAAYFRLFLANFTAVGSAFGVSLRILTVVPVLALLYYLSFAEPSEARGPPLAKIEDRIRPAYLYAATFGLAVLARFEMDRAHAVIAWAVLSIIFLVLGVRLPNRDFRAQASMLAIAAFIRSWTTNFYLTGSYYGMPERVATTIPVIVCLFAAGLLWRSRRKTLAVEGGPSLHPLIPRIDAHAASFMSLLAAILLALLIYYTVSGEVLTVAWAIQGLFLLIAGFVLTERILRLSGLALLGLCLFKVFLIDLEGIGAIARIFSFIILGTILLAASFVYARYRDRLRHYL